MKISVNENRDIMLEEVFNGVLLRADKGQELGICMRDGGFELNLIKPDGANSWHRLFDGKLTPMGKGQRDNG